MTVLDALLRFWPAPSSFGGGWYETFQPVYLSEDETHCVKASLEAVDGYIVEAGERVLVGIWIKALSKGKFKVESLSVRYEVDGTRYRQEDTYSVVAKVRLSRALPIPSWERACLSESTLLPGNRVR
ncbi:MAG: hypothetical protein ACRDK3_03740 [Actinomycetota bacterium]